MFIISLSTNNILQYRNTFSCSCYGTKNTMQPNFTSSNIIYISCMEISFCENFRKGTYVRFSRNLITLLGLKYFWTYQKLILSYGCFNDSYSTIFDSTKPFDDNILGEQVKNHSEYFYLIKLDQMDFFNTIANLLYFFRANYCFFRIVIKYF